MGDFLKDRPALLATKRGERLKSLRDEIQYKMGNQLTLTSHIFTDKYADMTVVFRGKRYRITVEEDL